MWKYFLYTKQYTWFDFLMITIAVAAARHDDWGIAGVAFVAGIILSTTIDWYYNRKS